jgi:uncharacterized membrane protein
MRHAARQLRSWLIFDVRHMQNIAVILGLLFGGFAIARLCGANARAAGRIGIAAVFAFTAMGHFARRDEMSAMIPVWIPARTELVVLSGVMEAIFAMFILVPKYSRTAGIVICLFLVMVTPLNIYAAIERVDFGGHVAGPPYLMLRLPLQAVLLVWTYWFTVRREEKPA